MLFLDLFRHDPNYIEIERGATLFKEGDSGELMYVLVEGRAEVSIGGLSFGECAAGDFVGEMAVVDASPRHATITARTDCKFIIIDRHRFLFLIDETPGFAVEVIRIMARRLRECDMRVLQTSPQITLSEPG